MMAFVKINDLISEKITGEWGVEPDDGNAISVLRTTNFTNEGRLNLSSVAKRSIDLRIVKKKKLVVGDTIIEKSGGSPSQPVGRVVYFDVDDGKEYLCNNFTAILRPNHKVFPKYFFFALFYKHWNNTTLRYQSKTTGIINLKLERYIQEEIPLPPLPLQKQIASILEIIKTALEMRAQSDQLTQKLLESAFLEMFGDPLTNPMEWEIITLGDITSTITKGETPLWKGDSYVESGVLFLRSENVLTGSIDLSKKTFISKEVHDRMRRSKVKKKDVLLNIVGASIGRSAVYEEDCQANINQAISIIRPMPNLSPYYLSYLLNSAGMQRKFKKLQAGVARDNLNLGQLRELKIQLPDMSQQNRFTSLVIKVKSLQSLQQKSEMELDNLFGSLMQRAFRGELF